MSHRDKSVLWLGGALVASALLFYKLAQTEPKPEPIPTIQCSVAGLRPGDSADKARKLLGPPGDTSDDHPDADWRELSSTWVYPGGRWLSMYDGRVLGISDKTLTISVGTRPKKTVGPGTPLKEVHALLGPGTEDEYVADHEWFKIPGSRGTLTLKHHDGLVQDVYLSGEVSGGRVFP